ncbi:glutamine synthetase family protein [Oharaeibacter diazotrophicus]|uniref:Glutamine synthetase n=1 Tax=Oharaeibacter diazotrophicus TaxID=1920512 RepID=A0A4R6RJP2_9HYPH|nr:glutamine synthetase [Oharaeibacter diazotrophicus]TDP86325.1 glutamine synthetase [Oharaeibacter diazotrophicus]BBE71732.1 glutamine synthetase [Pleomorphomonas sp. SM30]GLS78498.1 glutamine synthetase [Oharaeibacter diazotrophicus]
MSTMPENAYAEADLASRLAAIGARTVHVGVVDPEGEFRDKQVSADKALKLGAKGYPFCEVLYFWDIAEATFRDAAFVDRPAALMPETVRRYPFADDAAVVIADFTGDFGRRSPRNLCARLIAEAADLGFDVLSAFEFEFFLFAETAETMRAKNWRDLSFFAQGNRTYSLQTAALHGGLIDGLVSTMDTLGIALDAVHTELGPGCLEAPLTYAVGMKAPDDAVLFKNFARAYFARQGLTAGFMSKLSPSLSGQSGHLHVSLRDRAGNPAFADPAAPDGLGRTARHFVGGLVKLMPELLVLCASTVNAYKRLVPGAWAPTAANWGVQNRTAAVRVINDEPAATRVEFRVPSADTNPYLALALCLGAGLHGIRNEIEPPPGSAENFYAATPAPEAVFPRDLGAAADRLAASAAARAIFGADFVDGYVEGRRVEYDAYQRHVSEWELRRYLGIV